MNVPEKFGLALMLVVAFAALAIGAFIPNTVSGLEAAVWVLIALIAAWGLWPPRPPSP